ncbi:MAG TPA: serine/threonine-protein kinase [Kofleriaceae bacterium]|nr:serine/threonine-protein kinase [Kofleriaceae bacterium]
MIEGTTEGRIGRQGAETVDAPAAAGTATTAAGSAPASGPAAEPARLARGAVLGRYVIEELIGAGGMGVVYRARDPDLGRAVAIKQLGRVRRDWQWRARLLREAQSMARLAHPNVVTVYDVGLAHDGLFVAMEYVEGVTLRRWLAQPRSRHEIIAAFAGAGRGLHAAHLAGLVHRDFKPDNVLIAGDGRARVTDFGLARWEAAEAADLAEDAGGAGGAGGDRSAAPAGLTVDDAVMGTPGYMAAEQYAGAAVDARTDQFAFTCALFEALHGERPFAGDPDAIREAVLAGRPLAHPRDLPAWLRRILDRGLETDRERRFASMAELVAALEADPVAARRRRAIAIAVAAVVAIAGGGYAATAARDRDQRLAACREAPDELAGSWDATRKAAIAAGFGVAERPGRARTWAKLEQLVDRRAAALRAAREQTCLASARGEQSRELAAKRSACLDERRDELVALTGLMARSDSDPASLIAAARRVQAIDRCSDTDRLAGEPAPPGDPARRVALGDIRAALGAARMMTAAGRLGLAMEQAQRAADLARAAGDPALAAEAMAALADVKLGGPEQRWPVVWQAMRDTAAAGTAQAHARAVTVVARDFAAAGKFEDAERWSWLAVGLAGRSGDPHDLALALTVEGHVAWQLGKATDALTALERCANTAREPDVVSVGVELKCMVLASQVTIQLGQRDRTIASADAVIARGTERADELGVRETYELWTDTAVILINAHEERRALELLQRAQDLYQEAAAHRDPSAVIDTYERATLALERGVALLQLGRAGEAADELATAQAGLGGFELVLVQAKLYRAEAERRRGQPEQARTLLHEIEGSQTLTPRDRAMLYTIVANLELDRGDCKAAERAIARAASYTTPDESPDEQGDRLFAPARLAVARSRPDAPAQIAAARAAFERAHNAFRIAEIDALHGDRCR